jgi:hypothetical protein
MKKQQNDPPSDPLPKPDMGAKQQPKPERRRFPVSPEIAAELQRRRGELGAASATAQAIVAAAQSSAQNALLVPRIACESIERFALLHVGLEEGTIVATEGLGTDTVMVVELPLPPEPTG